MQFPTLFFGSIVYNIDTYVYTVISRHLLIVARPKPVMLLT